MKKIKIQCTALSIYCSVNRTVGREILSLVLKYFNVLINILKYYAAMCNRVMFLAVWWYHLLAG